MTEHVFSILEYHVLLALSQGRLHGYAIKDAIAADSDGTQTPRAGSLYRVIGRLLVQGIITETEGAGADARAAHPGHARRYYALTPNGKRALAAEAQRLKRTAQVAAKRLGTLGGRS
ncbi:MAG: PadR family transcriptional regulator [Gemmatimonadaceae bacterium]